MSTRTGADLAPNITDFSGAAPIRSAGLAYEGIAVRSADYREGVRALQEKRKPVFGRATADIDVYSKPEK